MTTYLDRLKTARTYHARYAETHALALLDRPDPSDRASILAGMRMHGSMRDTYDRQIAWMQRREGWVWPCEPAWTD